MSEDNIPYLLKYSATDKEIVTAKLIAERGKQIASELRQVMWEIEEIQNNATK